MMIDIDGQPFDPSIRHFTFTIAHRISRMEELEKLAGLKGLTSASFCNTNIDDMGLLHLSKAITIEDLNLQETEISNQGLENLARMPRLTNLRLKGNPQLNNDCITHLLKLNKLIDLQIHETSIDQSGLNRLASMAQIRDICIDEDQENMTFQGLLELSRQNALCSILVKGKGVFWNGTFDGRW